MLTDFGIAHMTRYPDSIFKTASGDTLCISLRWAARELLNCDQESDLNKTEPRESDSDSYDEVSIGIHTKETDIWAFGMVIYVRGYYNLVYGSFAHHITRK